MRVKEVMAVAIGDFVAVEEGDSLTPSRMLLADLWH
jgi:hypothetical protein